MADDFELIMASDEDALLGRDARLVDLLDGLLDQGVVLRGEAWISVADVDLVYLGLQVVIANPESLAK